MSILVTCVCTQTYRLPNRYAGKRCKCRECGERIRVPEESEETPRKRTKAKANRKRKREKQAVSRDTTRRLGAEAGTIIREGQQLREGISRRRPISESIHQLSPLHSQNMLDDVAAPSRRLEQKPRRRKKKARRVEAAETTEAKPRKQKKDKAKKDKPKKTKKDKKGKKDKAKKDKPKKTKKGTKTGKAKAAGSKVPRTRPKARGRAGRSTAKLGRRTRDDRNNRRRPARSSAAARRGRGDAGEDEAPRKRKSPTRHALMAVIAIVGVLCLGVGLIVGGGFSDKGAAKQSDADAKLDYLEALTFKQQWAAAVTEADKLEETFKDDAQAKSRLFKMRRGIDAMAQIATVEDPEAKLRNLLNFVRDKSPAVRLGVSLGLRKMAESPEAQRALLALTKDSDKRVAEASRMGMVHVGGKHSIPFLLEVIEQTAATGGKLGDLAVDQALQIQDAAVAPVLVKILEVRQSASATMLRQVLDRLSEVASDPKHAAAAKPYTTHKDEGVKRAAKAVIDNVG